MNPQRAAHLSGIAPAPMSQADGDAGESQNNDQGIGSAQSGYAGPENGPFECENCIHFDGTNKCDNPQVVADPEVNGQVEAEGCCNLFSPAGQGESDEQESEEGALSGAGEGGQ